jgi:hypothetical protein
MDRKARLYDAFGELIYVVAMADGIIQKEEMVALEKILDLHPWSREIKWSFDYEVNHHPPIEYLYYKVLNFCHDYGPAPEYQELIEIIEKIAEASAGIEPQEEKVITNFAQELTLRFARDLDRLELFLKRDKE